MRHAVLTLVLLVATGAPARAADPPSEGHRQAATELLGVMNLERTMLGGATAMVDATIQQNPALGSYRDVLLRWAEGFMNWETFGSRVVQMYVESFGESELRDMLGFYRTPTGQKALAVMPELMRRGAALGAQVAREHLPELEQMIRERDAELKKVAPKP